MKVLRRLRGLLGVGATWGVLWGGIGSVIGLIIGLIDPGAGSLGYPVTVWGLGMAAYGAVSGIGFGALLSLGEGSKVLRELSLRRTALWGVLGSALVPLAFMSFFDPGTAWTEIFGAMVTTGALGGVFAPGSVAIARRAALAEPDERPLLDA